MNRDDPQRDNWLSFGSFSSTEIMANVERPHSSVNAKTLLLPV